MTDFRAIADTAASAHCPTCNGSLVYQVEVADCLAVRAETRECQPCLERLSKADPPPSGLADRLVPPRPKAPESVACETCLDLGRVSRIRSGQTYGEPCPSCTDEDSDWDTWAELADDCRRGK